MNSFISKDNLFTIYNADSFKLLPQLEKKFDLIFADPPYFLSNDGLTIQSGKIVSVNKGNWDKKNKTNFDLDEFNLTWLKMAKEKLTDNGSIMISGTHHNIFSIGSCLQKLNYKILNIITWQKTNPPPNFSCRYLTHSTEQIIWARKSEKHEHIFNYKLMKRLNDNKQMKDVWAFSAIAPWEKSCGKHPTQKPLALLVRLILMATEKNSLVLDPFSGSSTTGIAANILRRKFMGIEKESEFYKISIQRKNELDANIKCFKNKIKDLAILGDEFNL